MGQNTCVNKAQYTRSPLEDSRLFGPSPWKILAATYEKKTISEQPSPWRKYYKRESCYGARCDTLKGEDISDCEPSPLHHGV